MVYGDPEDLFPTLKVKIQHIFCSIAGFPLLSIRAKIKADQDTSRTGAGKKIKVISDSIVRILVDVL
jgi:hypothetical protein